MTEINHTEYPKSLKSRSEDALRYTIKDASAAIKAMPSGHKAGYYADEIHYCAMEIVRRENAASKILKSDAEMDRDAAARYARFNRAIRGVAA